MSTNVVPFPLVKRREFVFRQAQTVSQYVKQGDPDIAELYLMQQLNRQRKKLERRGISEHHIERELLPCDGPSFLPAEWRRSRCEQDSEDEASQGWGAYALCDAVPLDAEQRSLERPERQCPR